MKRKRGSVVPFKHNPIAKEIASEMEELVDALVMAAETGDSGPDVRSCLQAAVDVAEWLRHVREKSLVQTSLYVPKMLRALAEKAVATGDTAAARLVLECLDMMPKKGGGVTVATQINISPQELEEIRKEINDDGVVDRV